MLHNCRVTSAGLVLEWIQRESKYFRTIDRPTVSATSPDTALQFCARIPTFSRYTEPLSVRSVLLKCTYMPFYYSFGSSVAVCGGKSLNNSTGAGFYAWDCFHSHDVCHKMNRNLTHLQYCIAYLLKLNDNIQSNFPFLNSWSVPATYASRSPTSVETYQARAA